MKKILPLLAAIAMMASGAVSAATTTIALNSGPNDYAMTDCSLLANDIQLILTSNVIGHIQCDDTNNFIAVGVCHTSGLVSDRSSVVTTDASGNVICTVAGAETCITTVTGSAYPTANTDNGTVTSMFPGTTCSAANVKSHVDAQQ